MQKWSPLRIGVVIAVTGGVLSGGAGSTPAKAAPKKSIVGREPWPAKRVVLVLPLRLGEGWNSDPNAGTLLIPPAQDEMHKALITTGKFSLIEAHRFNPILGRAVQDKLATQDQLDELVNNPSLESARQILSGMTFAQQPLIADFRLEEVRTSGATTRTAGRVAAPATIQVQVSGRLYEVTNPVAIKTVVITSDAIPRTRGRTTLDTAVLAASNAFNQIIAEFVAPLPDIEFAPTPTEPAATVTPAPAPVETPTAVVPMPPPPTSTLPGGGFAGATSAGSPFPMPVLPAPQPPLGITVPSPPAAPR